MGWVLALAPSAATVLAALRMGLVAQPDRGPFGGIPCELRPDHDLEFAAEALAAVASTLGIRIRPAPPFTPHLKGKVERLNRTVAQDFLCTLPFYTDGPATRPAGCMSWGLRRSPSSDWPLNSMHGSTTTLWHLGQLCGRWRLEAIPEHRGGLQEALGSLPESLDTTADGTSDTFGQVAHSRRFGQGLGDLQNVERDAAAFASSL